MKVQVLAACLGALSLAASSNAPRPPPFKPYLAVTLADSGRAADAAADERRKPGEIVAFSGLKPGQTVVDLLPGGGYWTRIFSKVVGPKGHVFVVWPNEYAKLAHPDPETSVKLAHDPHYGNMTAFAEPAAAFAAPQPVDTKAVFDPSIRGHTDQFVLRFRKY